MEKIFEMHTKRVITMHQAVKQYPDLVVYKDEKFVDGERLSSKEGFASFQEIQQIGKNESIQAFSKPYKTSRGNTAIKEVVLALKTDFREALRRNGMGGVEWKKLGIIENPFSLIQEIGMLDMENLDKYEAFYMSTYSHLVESLDEKQLPQGILFDYMSSNGGIDNCEFNLKNLLEAIKDRTDLDWKNRRKVAEITDIPGYNADEERYLQLAFRWMPSDEDYAKLNLKEKWKSHQEVMEKIFGLDLSESGNIRKKHREVF